MIESYGGDYAIPNLFSGTNRAHLGDLVAGAKLNQAQQLKILILVLNHQVP